MTKRKIKLLITFIFLYILPFKGLTQIDKSRISNNSTPTCTSSKSEEFTTEVLGEITPKSIDLKWKPLLINKCLKHKSNHDEELDNIKKTKLKAFKPDSTTNDVIKYSANLNDATVARNFLGNLNSGSTPLDNSLAISNNGNIVSVANTTIEFYDSEGNLTFSNGIAEFFNDPNISATCDPLVVYDSGSDKFIFFAQECSGSTNNTFLLLCFSQSNDPNGKWYKYKINGNPANNNTWFDYPKIGLSNNEIYITGNSFIENGPFKEALLYQIEKSNGFIGGSIKWQYWSNISGSPFTLLPVSNGHQGNYGPGCYLVSTASIGSNKIEFYDLTDDMGSTNEKINHYSVSTTAYSATPDAFQKGTDVKLDNGDCRALSGFYLNGFVHFTFHSEYSNGFQGINYNRLDVVNLKNVSTKFGLENYDYSYPSIASFTNDKTDKSVVIGFLRSGAGIYPEFRVVKCNDDMTWNGSVLVKEGEDFCTHFGTSSKPARWGDYTGISRKHNSTSPCVWANGMYGNLNNKWDTWITEISETNNSKISPIINNKLNTFPNPSNDNFNIEFEVHEAQKTIIELFDQNGKLIVILFNNIAYQGTNHFQFNTQGLAEGSYILKISADNKLLKNEKIVIAR